jgi:hypothetical protein
MQHPPHPEDLNLYQHHSENLKSLLLDSNYKHPELENQLFTACPTVTYQTRKQQFTKISHLFTTKILKITFHGHAKIRT